MRGHLAARGIARFSRVSLFSVPHCSEHAYELWVLKLRPRHVWSVWIDVACSVAASYHLTRAEPVRPG